MSGERTDGVKASELDAIEAKIRGEGCKNISELITKYNDGQANLIKAETARDKFALHNKEAEVIIGTKGGQLGTANQKVTELELKLTEAETTISDLTNKLEATGQTVIPPTANTTEKPIAEQLAEVEDKLTDEQKAQAQALMELVEDDNEAMALVNDPKVRLKFLVELTADPANKQRPKTFFKPEKAEQTPSGGEETVYQKVLAKLKGTTHGPSGRVVQPAGSPQQSQPTRKSVFY